MKKKLKCIMLVDDNRHDNFFHERVIRQTEASLQVIVQKKAIDAINHLKSIPATATDYPDLILLDINMPGMNGWEFLDEFKMLEKEKQATVIVMLTTSINPDDQLKAELAGIVADFRSKPLNKIILNEIIEKFFEPGSLAK